MKNKNLNIILIGIYILSLQIYGLKLIKVADVQVSSSYNNAYEYIFKEPVVTISIGLTIVTIIISFILGRKKQNYKYDNVIHLKRKKRWFK